MLRESGLRASALGLAERMARNKRQARRGLRSRWRLVQRNGASAGSGCCRRDDRSRLAGSADDRLGHDLGTNQRRRRALSGPTGKRLAATNENVPGCVSLRTGRGQQPDREDGSQRRA